MRRFKARFMIVLAILVFWLAGGAAAEKVKNPDNDPDLAKALEYSYIDKPISERAGTSREKAEKHYLRYLKRNEDPYRAAVIYFHLGAMLGNARPDFNEPRDREKAEKYFSKAIEADPHSLSRATLFARTRWASISPDPNVRFERRMEVLEFLLSLDEEAIEERLVMPPPPDLPPERRKTVVHEDGSTTTLGSSWGYDPEAAKARRVERIKDMVAGLASTTRTNLIYEAIGSPLPKAKLGELIRRFPDDKIAERAREEL